MLTFTSLKNRNHNAVCKASTHTQKNKYCQQWAGEMSISSTYWTQALYVLDHILCSIWFIEWVYTYELTLIMFKHMNYVLPKKTNFFCHYLSFSGLQIKGDFWCLSAYCVYECDHWHLTHTWCINSKKNTNGELRRK